MANPRMSQLQITGTSIQCTACKKEPTLSDFTNKFYRIPLSQQDEEVEQSSKFKTKDPKLQEVLYGEVEIKKRKITVLDKHLYRANSCPIEPSPEMILDDVYKRQRKTLEEMKRTLFEPYHDGKEEHCVLDSKVLHQYVTDAHQKLHQKHVDKLKKFIKDTEHYQTLKPKQMERQILKIQDICNRQQESLEEWQ